MKVDGKYVPPLTPDDGVTILNGADAKKVYDFKGYTRFKKHCGCKMMKFEPWVLVPTVIFPAGARAYQTGVKTHMCPICGYYYENVTSGGECY